MDIGGGDRWATRWARSLFGNYYYYNLKIPFKILSFRAKSKSTDNSSKSATSGHWWREAGNQMAPIIIEPLISLPLIRWSLISWYRGVHNVCVFRLVVGGCTMYIVLQCPVSSVIACCGSSSTGGNDLRSGHNVTIPTG